MHANFSLLSFSSILSYYFFIFLTLKENALMNASKVRSSLPEVFCMFLNFRSIYRKITVLESLINKVATLLKETPGEIFSCESCDIFRNIFFTEQLWATTSVKSNTIFFLYRERSCNAKANKI